MPTQKPRIALTVPEDLNELLDNLSELMGKPKSTFIVEFLTDVQPLFQELYNSLSHAKEMKDNIPSLIRLTAMANQQVGVMNSEMSELMSQIGKDEK
jgi:predicted DNA-binding protein